MHVEVLQRLSRTSLRFLKRIKRRIRDINESKQKILDVFEPLRLFVRHNLRSSIYIDML